MDQLVECDNPNMMRAYQRKIETLESEHRMIASQSEEIAAPKRNLDQIYRTACLFLSNPLKLWHSDNLMHKRMVLRLCFTSKLAYQRGEGYRTAAIAEPFRIFQGFFTGESGMVEQNEAASNLLYQTLDDWECLLQDAKITLEEEHS